jgi:hypothetical protein
MRISHPGSDDDDWVYVAGSRYAVTEGLIDCPESDAKALADAYDTTVAELAVNEDGDAEICGTEMSDGTVCERPAAECPYHS